MRGLKSVERAAKRLWQVIPASPFPVPICGLMRRAGASVERRYYRAIAVAANKVESQVTSIRPVQAVLTRPKDILIPVSAAESDSR